MSGAVGSVASYIDLFIAASQTTVYSKSGATGGVTVKTLTKSTNSPLK